MAASTQRPLAIVTGASAGIGAEYARQLAAQGYDLLLTARRADRLLKLATELQDSYQVQCRTCAADLVDPAAPEQIYAAATQDGADIDLLVNNAGFGVAGAYASQTWQAHEAFLQVMVTAVCHLTHRVLPGMLARQRGAIVNVASVAGLIPGSAGNTLYGAAKSLMIGFSEALAAEVRNAGIRVQVVCPGFTLSEFHDVLGTRERVSRMPGVMWLSAERVVADSLAALQRRRPPVVVIPGWIYRVLVMLSRKLPHRWLLAAMHRRPSRH